MRYLKTNTATIVTVGPFYDKTDGVTIETALTITNEQITFVVDNNDGSAPTLVLDNVTGATSGTSNDLNYITNCDAGLMQLELAAANVNYLGRAMLTITDAANHCPVFHEFMILPAMVFDSLIAGTDVMQADMTQILGTAVSTPATAGLLDVNAIQLSGDATAANNAESFFDGTGYAGTNNVIPTVTTVGTTTNLTNLPAAAALEATLTAMKGATFAGATDSLEAIRDRGDAAWATATGFATPTNITAGTITTVTNLTNAPTSGDLTATMKASVTTAATAATPTAAAVTGAVGSVTAPVTAGTVSDKTGYALSSAGVQAIWDALTSALTTAGSVGKRIADYLDVAVSSRGTSIYAGGDTSGTTTLLSRIVGTLATGTHSPQSGDSYARLGAPAGASVSADVAEVKTLTDGHGTLNYGLSTSIYNLLNTEIAEILADTNELQTDWANGGRLDLLLDAASSAGDPWATALPGAYGAGTAGKLIGDNINAPIATIDTVVDAIKAKTDALPTDPADQSAVEAAITAATSGLATAAALATVAGYVDTEVAAILAAVDTEVAAIKAKTDNLPASPAAVGSAMTLTSAYDAAKTAATQTSVDDLPTNAELATALAGADDATLAAIAALNNLSSAQAQTAATAALNAYDPPTNAEMEARTLLAASYFDPATDTVARVTLVDTTTTNTDMVAAAPSAADIKTALEADGSKLDHLWEMTEDDVGVRRLTANALEEAPAGGGGGTADWTAGEREQIRYRLQLDGTQTAPADPDLPAVNVTLWNDAVAPALLDLDTVLETPVTLGEALRVMLAALAGKTDGSGTPALTFLGQDGATVRIAATVDGIGNRTAVTVDGA